MAAAKTERNVGFARKQLEKHGWCEGKGLGKEESGISKAIKVNIKTDTAGVGYDAGDQFSFHWWDHVFNKTAKSIVVQESDEGVEVVKSSKESCTVSNKRPSKNTNKPLLYGRFVKASSQTLESVTPDSDEEDTEKDFSHLCAEEKLFQACGGRTAHKAARHGFRLNGKLQRVEEQEKLAVAGDRCRSNTTEDSSDSDVDTSAVEEKQQTKEKENDKKVKSNKKDKERKKGKRKHKDMQKNNEQKLQDEHVSCESEVVQKRVKKKKKKSKKVKT
ncbi:hypothetical protein ACROYT_G036702 [Oculina patagonica]